MSEPAAERDADLRSVARGGTLNFIGSVVNGLLQFLLVVIVKRLYGANTREWNIAVFTGFISVYLVLTIVGTSFRGPGMDLFAPWAVPAKHCRC